MLAIGRVLLLGWVSIVLMKETLADEWKINGSVDQSMEYDDNLGLRAISTPVFGYRLRPSVAADWIATPMQIGLNASGDIRRYDDERWDCENVSLGLNQRYQLKRNVFSLSGRYAQSCSYSQQISDTGILAPSNQTDNYSFAPGWMWQWTPIDQLSFSPSYSQTTYSGAPSNGNAGNGGSFRSNETYSLNLTEKHEWSRRLGGTVSTFYSHSEYGASGSNPASGQNVFGAQLGGQYQLSRAWSVNASGGGRWVQSPSGSSSSASGDSLLFGQLANLDLTYKDRATDWSFGYSRSVNPSAFGQVLQYSSVNMHWNYKLTREWSIKLDGSYKENQAVGQSLNQSMQNRNYYSASAEMVWRFAREWSLSASYRYRRQEYPDSKDIQAVSLQAGTQDSNAIMINLNYNWDGLRVSR